MCSATSNSILDKAIDSEEAQHNDILRLVRCILFNILNNYVLKLFPGLNSYGLRSSLTLLPVIQEHVEGYHELSAKTKVFFSTAVAIWDADFYVKVDDDVHVNLGAYLDCPIF